MAAYGLRPAVEIQFADYVYPATDQIVSEAARLRYRSAGDFTCPITIRMPCGGGIYGGQTHSQSPEAMFTQVCGLRTVMPSNPYDAKGLLIQSIRDNDPVIFLEPKRLYNGPFDGHHDRPVQPWNKHELGKVPEGYYTVPLDKAAIFRPGKAVTVLAYGTMVWVAECAARETGIDAEVIDLRSLWPLDLDTIVESVKKTGRCVVVHEATRTSGFGAELVAVIPDESLSAAPTRGGRPAAKHDQQPLPWSEMPAPSMTVLLHPDGDNLDSVLHARTARLTVHDPYVESAIMLRGQRVPLAANFTAGYGVWLARANFNRQSLRSLLGREGGIDRPHVYLMQPYDPNRRIIVMLHGLASSPEAWVELANEILGDEALRQHYQIWQVYYPTNMPVALNHAMIRRALGDTLTHFDPSGQAPASSDLVLVGHSMGGVIARLMVSSTDQSLVQLAADHSRLTPQQIRRIDPMLRFEPFPNVSSAIFIAAPHRGTSVAGGRLGRWMAGFIRFPITVLEELAHTLAPNAAASSRESLATIPNSVNNLDENDPFVRTAAGFPISSQVRYHSIVAQANSEVALDDSDDGLVPYRSAHLPGAQSEKVIISGHSVQQSAAAILEIQRILREDMALREAHLQP